jgi:hypothetical protein
VLSFVVIVVIGELSLSVIVSSKSGAGVKR